jgi:hypothetical protein
LAVDPFIAFFTLKPFHHRICEWLSKLLGPETLLDSFQPVYGFHFIKYPT